MAIVIDKAGGWWLGDEGLASTQVTQAQATVLLRDYEDAEAGSTDVRFGDAFGELLVVTVAGQFLLMGEDGVCEDVTGEVG